MKSIRIKVESGNCQLLLIVGQTVENEIFSFDEINLLLSVPLESFYRFVSANFRNLCDYLRHFFSVFVRDFPPQSYKAGRPW